MALLKFELTEQYISLCRNVDLETFYKNKILIDKGKEDIKEELYDDFGLILYGKPDIEFDPDSTEDVTWTEDQKIEMDNFIKGLPTALKIIQQNGFIELGEYKTKHYLIEWKKSK